MGYKLPAGLLQLHPHHIIWFQASWNQNAHIVQRPIFGISISRVRSSACLQFNLNYPLLQRYWFYTERAYLNSSTFPCTSTTNVNAPWQAVNDVPHCLCQFISHSSVPPTLIKDLRDLLQSRHEYRGLPSPGFRSATRYPGRAVSMYPHGILYWSRYRPPNSNILRG